MGRSNNGIFVKLSNENTYFVREHSFSVRRQCHVTGGVIVLLGDSTFDGSGWLAGEKDFNSENERSESIGVNKINPRRLASSQNEKPKDHQAIDWVQFNTKIE